jgi:hypothetical protein
LHSFASVSFVGSLAFRALDLLGSTETEIRLCATQGFLADRRKACGLDLMSYLIMPVQR